MKPEQPLRNKLLAPAAAVGLLATGMLAGNALSRGDGDTQFAEPLPPVSATMPEAEPSFSPYPTTTSPNTGQTLPQITLKASQPKDRQPTQPLEETEITERPVALERPTLAPAVTIVRPEVPSNPNDQNDRLYQPSPAAETPSPTTTEQPTPAASPENRELTEDELAIQAGYDNFSDPNAEHRIINGWVHFTGPKGEFWMNKPVYIVVNSKIVLGYGSANKRGISFSPINPSDTFVSVYDNDSEPGISTLPLNGTFDFVEEEGGQDGLLGFKDTDGTTFALAGYYNAEGPSTVDQNDPYIFDLVDGVVSLHRGQDQKGGDPTNEQPPAKGGGDGIEEAPTKGGGDGIQDDPAAEDPQTSV